MLPLVWARFGLWDRILPLTLSDFDYTRDGMMLPRGAEPFNLAVYHYTRAMALAASSLQSSGTQDSAEQISMYGSE